MRRYAAVLDCTGKTTNHEQAFLTRILSFRIRVRIIFSFFTKGFYNQRNKNSQVIFHYPQ